MRRIVRILNFIVMLALSVCTVLVLTVYAHPGKTDANGGHYDRSTGTYHYHHGFEAHQHTDLDGNGTPECPYDFIDKAGGSSGSTSHVSNASSAAKVSGDSTAVKEKEVPVEVLPEWAKYALAGAAAVVAFSLVTIQSKANDISYLSSQLAGYREKYDTESEKSNALLKDNNAMLLSVEETKAKAIAEIDKQKRIAFAEIEKERGKRLELYKAVLDRHLIEKIKADLGEEYLLVLSDAPNGITFDSEGLPHKIENGYDIFLIPVSDSGKYHRPSCRYASRCHDVHVEAIIKSSRSFIPCSICSPFLPNIAWLAKYHRYKKQLEFPDSNWRDLIDIDGCGEE